jgi:hypothetical protein
MGNMKKAPAVATAKDLRESDLLKISPENTQQPAANQGNGTTNGRAGPIRVWRVGESANSRPGIIDDNVIRTWEADDPVRHRPVAQARKRRKNFARNMTFAEFGEHRGTRLSIDIYAEPGFADHRPRRPVRADGGRR